LINRGRIQQANNGAALICRSLKGRRPHTTPFDIQMDTGESMRLDFIGINFGLFPD
jgi:hypothetical protein